jgi:hypothetical protein
MKRPTLFILVVLVAACSADQHELPDGGEICKTPQLAALIASEKRWKTLAAKGGDDYWYEHERCSSNALQGSLLVVQVEAGEPREHGMSSIEQSECELELNVYESLGAKTFEELYAMCRKLLEQHCGARFVADDRGVLRTCQWEYTDNCLDNCGEGVHLRRWGFGQAP